MSSFLFIFAALLYALVLLILFIYGVNFLYLALITWRRDGTDPGAPPLTGFPYVTVQLPIYNELYVAERLIDASARLDWPSSLLEIQVLDDSTDETREIVCETVERWRAHGVNIQQIHRVERAGFKAGALLNGMRQAHGEFLAYFDADFVPPRDFLIKTVPHFANPELAFVQTRWGHMNRDYSLLTFLQSLAIDAHFVVEQFARSRGDYWFNFNGTAGVWRRAALEAAGGWHTDTLTEDLDVSYRAFLKGWKGLYLRDVVTPAELPVTFGAFRRQQHRWAKGSLECAVKLLPQVWNAPISFRQKLEATLHLTGYCIHLFMFALMLVYPAVVYFSQQFPDLLALYGVGALFNLSALAPTMYFTLAQGKLGRDWWRKIPAILFIMALGAGMMTNTVRATWQIAFGRGKTFERTPKFGIAKRSQSWLESRYQLSLDPIIFAELLVGLWNLGTLIYALELHIWLIALYAAIFLTGVMFVSGLTIAQNVELWSYQKKKAQSSTVVTSS
jgi:cellulose synthase/poly-beta-1,6-N-acetylglucosamine synthase-like glycosyltransferase